MSKNLSFTPRTVAEIPPEYILVQDSPEIEETLRYLDQSDEKNVGCLFILVGEGDYDAVFACSSFIPCLDRSVRRLF